MLKDGLPLKVSTRADAAWILASFSRRAMDAAPMTRGPVPNWLPSTTRTADPPMLACTIWRNGWLLKCMNPGEGGGAAGQALGMKGGGPPPAGALGACGRPTAAVAQVPTQCSPALCARMPGEQANSAAASPHAPAMFRPA